MNFAKYNEHSKPLFTQLRLLPFDHMREDKTARITYSIVRNNHPFPVSLFNSPLRHTRNFSLNNFNLPLTHNVYGERLIQYVGAKVWNKIPVDLRNDHNFCKKLKNHFLLLYAHECPQHQKRTCFFFLSFLIAARSLAYSRKVRGLSSSFFFKQSSRVMLVLVVLVLVVCWYWLYWQLL